MHQNQLEDLLKYSFLGPNPEFWVSWSGFVLSRSVMFDSATLWTVACQTLSMGFLWQEYWSGLPFPPPGDLPDPGIKPASPLSPAFQVASLPTEPLRKSGLGLEHLRIYIFNKFSGRHPDVAGLGAMLWEPLLKVTLSHILKGNSVTRNRALLSVLW